MKSRVVVWLPCDACDSSMTHYRCDVESRDMNVKVVTAYFVCTQTV